MFSKLTLSEDVLHSHDGGCGGYRLLSLFFDDIAGKELERAMACVILGGLFTSTLLNMIVIPVLYMKYGWESEGVFVCQLAIERGEIFVLSKEC